MASINIPMIDKNRKEELKQFASWVWKKLEESTSYMIVTVAITGMTLTYMFQIIPPVYSSTIPGLYLFGMLVQLFIRIVRRFDESNTTQELAERFIEFEHSINERLDEIIRNQMPY